MDCIEGPKGKGDNCLLTMVDRKLRKTLIFKLPSQTQDSVIKVLDMIERKMGRVKFAEKFKIITVDNGGEFLNHKKMERSLRGKKRSGQRYIIAIHIALGKEELMNKPMEWLDDLYLREH